MSLPVYISYNAVGFDFFMVLLFGITRLKSWYLLRFIGFT